MPARRFGCLPASMTFVELLGKTKLTGSFLAVSEEVFY
jgi:hypothetical protein